MMMHYFYHMDYPHVSLHRELIDVEAALPAAPVQKSATPSRSRKSKLKVAVWEDIDIATQIRDPNLIIHANVYAVAEQYAIDGLKAVALEKFVAETKVHWATEDFLQAVELVYSSTPEHDRGLRDVVRNTFYERKRDLMDKENVKRYLREVPDLAYDVLLHVHKEGV